AMKAWPASSEDYQLALKRAAAASSRDGEVRPPAAVTIKENPEVMEFQPEEAEQVSAPRTIKRKSTPWTAGGTGIDFEDDDDDEEEVQEKSDITRKINRKATPWQRGGPVTAEDEDESENEDAAVKAPSPTSLFGSLTSFCTCNHPEDKELEVVFTPSKAAL
ncbi:unnamed protein product, partial [Polarella glacialis]